MQRARIATQCTTHTGETGSFLYDSKTGEGYPNVRFNPVSPVFPGLIELFAWCDENGWRSEFATLSSDYIKD